MVTSTCPWCYKTWGFRNLSDVESLRLARRIFWQSAAVAFIRPRPPGQASALVGAKGTELACRNCDGLVRVCPNCDKAHRWLNAQLLECGCRYSFL
jgi:hypothetical protein